tara:strand:+ start:2762 stop:2932 length:171 start_codon:yes stop_codon:yes gene_type:complete
MALTKKEIHQVDEMIKSYKNTITYIRSQIVDLERKKLKDPTMKKFDFRIIKKENRK